MGRDPWAPGGRRWLPANLPRLLLPAGGPLTLLPDLPPRGLTQPGLPCWPQESAQRLTQVPAPWGSEGAGPEKAS